MSANNKQAPNSVPTLCKSGCGFFGSEATGGCCSKCWMASLKNDVDVADNSGKTASACNLIDRNTAATTTTKTFKEPAETSQTPSPTASITAPLKKKKKKKAGYKNMMAGMMAGSDKKDIAKEQEYLAKGLGGGNFSKIQKI